MTRIREFVGRIEAFVIGAVAGVLSQEAVGVIRNRLKIDDKLDVFAVHCIGGIFGTVMIVLFGQGAWAAQLGSLAIVGVFTVAVTYVLVKLVRLVTAMRVDPETETNGLDLGQFGERAYDMSSQRQLRTPLAGRAKSAGGAICPHLSAQSLPVNRSSKASSFTGPFVACHKRSACAPPSNAAALARSRSVRSATVIGMVRSWSA